MNEPIGISYQSPAVYPVSNNRYLALRKENELKSFAEALSQGKIPVQNLKTMESYPAAKAISLYDRKVKSYPAVFYVHRAGLLGETTIVPLDAALMGYADNLLKIDMTGLPFKKEAFNALQNQKQVIAVRDFVEGKLFYNATKLTKGNGVPTLVMSQGPQTPATIALFVKLIIENQITHVVALGISGLERQYCKYWPAEVGASLKVEGATLTLLSQETLGTDCDKEQKLVKRVIQLDILNIGSRKVTQYQLMGWEEVEEPLSFTLFDRLQNHLRKVKPEENVLIHCHDGMSRSSVAVLAFLALKQMEKEVAEINLLDLSFRLYTERPCVTDEKCVKIVFDYLRKQEEEKFEDC